MGNFYTNYTLRGVSQQAVADVLAGRLCIVTPSMNDTVVVYDEASDDQDQRTISSLATKLSRELHCPVLAVLNHDDDILWYQLFVGGDLQDEYDSSPGYFDSAATEPSAPAGGDARKLCSFLGSPNAIEVERILRKSAFDEGGYTFEFERHADLVKALGISDFGVATAYASFENDELPEGLSSGDVIRTA